MPGDAIMLFHRKMCLYVTFFSFNCLSDVFNEKTYSLLHFPIILGDGDKCSLIYSLSSLFCYNFIGKDEVFQGLL